jgi:hypothetical protein
VEGPSFEKEVQREINLVFFESLGVMKVHQRLRSIFLSVLIYYHPALLMIDKLYQKLNYEVSLLKGGWIGFNVGTTPGAYIF